MSFSRQDVIGILSHEHKINTSFALRKQINELTPEDLIIHWEKFHLPTNIQRYDILPEEDSNEHLFV